MFYHSSDPRRGRLAGIAVAVSVYGGTVPWLYLVCCVVGDVGDRRVVEFW